jgi:hypothetical protein
MDFETIKQGVSTAIAALSYIKQAKELLPEGSKKNEIDGALQETER